MRSKNETAPSANCQVYCERIPSFYTVPMAAQRPDIIFLNNDKHDLFSNPLEEYWIAKKKRRPAFYTEDDCRRGYVASWLVKDKALYIQKIEARFDRYILMIFKKTIDATLRSIFGKLKQDLVKATWFSGKLRIPFGKMTEYVHEGYASHFEKELIITVNKGSVIKEVMLDYTHQRLVVTSIT